MLKFQSIRWKNILSTGNAFTEINFTKSPNTLIIGNNGAGKSTILDALCFGLFGKPFRKITKPGLLNSINRSHGMVEIEFAIGTKQYKIVRGIKPNVFEMYCNGELINQDAKAKDYQEHLEKHILKLNFKSFTQVVILGSASFVPFMQLAPGDRRSIIEDLLDILIFSSMNNIVKEKLNVIRDNIVKTKYDIDLTKEKIKLQKHNIEEHKKHNEEEIEIKLADIVRSESQIAQLVKAVDLIQQHIDVFMKRIADKPKAEKYNKELLQLESKVENNIKNNQKHIDFYELNDNCPTCSQVIEPTFKDSKLKEIKKKWQEQTDGLKKIEEEITKVTSRLAEIKKINVHITEHNNEIIKHNSTISAINSYISKTNKEIQKLRSKKDSLEDENEKLQAFNVELEKSNEEMMKLMDDKKYNELAASLLKDTGIKTKIIKQYLPIMNKLINKYLAAMNFFVNFNINENFEEIIKSRHRDEFKYDSFSEGEKQKIDMALLLTWRQIAKLKNSTNTNLLILDEIFDSSLDTTGVELLMSILSDLSTETNVFVISHKGDQLFDKFKNIIKFEQKNNFSQIVS